MLSRMTCLMKCRPGIFRAMYERFTDRARRVMQFANDEAKRFKHEYLGTEHVLLGLIKEGHGVAAAVIQNLGGDLQKIRNLIEQVTLIGEDEFSQVETPRTKRAIEHSLQEARDLKHSYIGTEHILLGLLHDKNSVAGQVLGRFGLTLENVRVEIVKLVGKGLDQ